MKIHQILGAPPIFLTNEEQNFINARSKSVPIGSLHERDEVIARNLVRKGVYSISKDKQHLILN